MAQARDIGGWQLLLGIVQHAQGEARPGPGTRRLPGLADEGLDGSRQLVLALFAELVDRDRRQLVDAPGLSGAHEDLDDRAAEQVEKLTREAGKTGIVCLAQADEQAERGGRRVR